MTHSVQVDEDQAAATFEQHEGAPEVTPEATPGEPAEQPEGAGWGKEAELAASFLAHKVCPAWQVPAEVQQQWAEALAACADRVMPGGLGNVDSWGPWAQLLFASGAWLMCGLDLQQFTLKPLHPPPEHMDQPPAADQGAESPDMDTRFPRGGGGFSTNA